VENPAVRFDRVLLCAPAASLRALDDFYADRLGLESVEEPGLRVGETGLAFVAGSGEPFYHFALLAPGDRFGAALKWLERRVELLPDPETREPVFDFDNWDALACYFHDPAGNIVELIAHRGVEESGRQGPFGASELVGVSELGLVGDKRELAAALGELGLEQWTGDLDAEGRLAFVGEKARTLILAPPGRGWFPIGRPAEAHPTEVELEAPSPGVVHVGQSRIVGILQS
jgi:catechol 2,3-dioxygenase-like lactoylglutathione lyase family enzyme